MPISTHSAPTIEQRILTYFPELDSFEIQQDTYHSVVPVEKVDFRAGYVKEYPPIVRWRIKDRNFAYVLFPTFSIERKGMWPFFWDQWVVDYNGEDVKLIDLIKLTIKETNELELAVKLANMEVPLVCGVNFLHKPVA